MKFPSSLSFEQLIACARGDFFGPGNAKLPAPPMLMMDRITDISADAGEHGKGHIVAEFDIRPDLWFFKCHFPGNPIMPGCLGLDGLWQLTWFNLGWRGWQARQATRAAQQVPTGDPVIELAAIDLATAQTQLLRSGLPITGVLKAERSAIVKARVPGELRDLTVREGDTVQVGQVIARVESTEYADRVRQAQQQADAARAQVDIAQRQYDNNAALVQQGFISPTALDNSLASLNAARIGLRD